MASNDIDLKPWVELVPMLKDFQLGGTARFDAEASGPVDKLGYHVDAKIAGLTAKAPKLKAEPRSISTLTSKRTSSRAWRSR